MAGKVLRASAALVVCFGLAFCASAPKKQVKSRESDPQYQYNLGASYLQMNELDEAIKHFNNSLALNPRYFLAWNGIGSARSMKNDLQGAATAYEKCIEINPKFSEARNNLGIIYQEMGYLDRAETEFQKAAEDQTYVSRELPLCNLSRLYLSMNKPDEAYISIQLALELKPRFALGHNVRGQVLERMGDLAEAIKSYDRAVKLIPSDILFSFTLGVAMFKNNDLDNAKDVLEGILPRVSDTGMKAAIKEILFSIKEKQIN